MSRKAAGERVARLTELGFAVRRGRRLALRFPVFDTHDSDILAPVIDDIARRLIAETIAPRLVGLEDLLRGRGYGHLGDQFPMVAFWANGDICGEGLRTLMERGLLPRPPEPAPWHFAFLAWRPGIRLMSWAD